MEKEKIELTETELEVQKVLESRWVLGRKRYGEGISYKQSDSSENWITMAIEEAADMLQYLVALKLKLEKEESN